LTFKKIRKKLMPKELFANNKKKSVTFKEMRPINLEQIVRPISIEYYHYWIKPQLL